MLTNQGTSNSHFDHEDTFSPQQLPKEEPRDECFAVPLNFRFSLFFSYISVVQFEVFGYEQYLPVKNYLISLVSLQQRQTPQHSHPTKWTQSQQSHP